MILAVQITANLLLISFLSLMIVVNMDLPEWFEQSITVLFVLCILTLNTLCHYL